MKRWTRIFAPIAAMAVVIAAGVAALGNTGSNAQSASALPAAVVAKAQPQPPTVTEESTSAADTDTVEQQDGSQDTADANEAPEAADANEPASDPAAETAEAAALVSKVTISAHHAKGASMAANPT